MEKKKILYYNWCPFDVGQGGGVSVYVQNLLEYSNKNENYDTYFLSSGYCYNPFTEKTYIRELKTKLGKDYKTYEIVNSDVIGPLGNLRYSIDKYLYGTKAVEVAKEFINEHGPFDIINIQNIGGIGIEFLNLKKDFPNTKFIFNLHNYNSVCMNSYLFQHNTAKMCNGTNKGEACTHCFDNIKITKNLYISRIKNFCYEKLSLKMLFKLGNLFKIFDKKYTKYYQISSEHNEFTAENYEIFKNKNIEYLNKFDSIVAVSERVKEVAIKHGLSENKITVSYIGTKFAENILPPKMYQKDGTVKIAYLGYANVLKGFYFLLQALSTLPEELKSKIDIVFAAKNLNNNIKNLLIGFNSVKFYDGYSHKNLNSILSDVDLGIIPVLWEDNLPQVAIEMVASGTPILCSSFGGASELCRDESFKFKGGDREDFIRKLTTFVEQPELLNNFWKSNKKLVTMDEHIKELEELYK